MSKTTISSTDLYGFFGRNGRLSMIVSKSRRWDADELKLVLARAFDRAWTRYDRPGQVRTSPDVARPVLAKHLVQMAKDGVADESKLAAGAA